MERKSTDSLKMKGRIHIGLIQKYESTRKIKTIFEISDQMIFLSLKKC